MEKIAWLFLAIILLSVQRVPVFKERTKQFQTNVETLSPFLTVQNAQSHVLVLIQISTNSCHT